MKSFKELDEIFDPTGDLDGLKLYERIELLNSYILSNYKKHDEFDEYIILEKK